MTAAKTLLRFPARALMHGMRDAFMRKADGLSQIEFVEALLHRARELARKKKKDEEEAIDSDESDLDEESEDEEDAVKRPLVGADGRINVRAVADACEFFQEVDVNGNGRITWQQFTKFIIDQSMPSRNSFRQIGSHDQYIPRQGVSIESIGFRKPGEAGSGPLRLARWIPELETLCLGAVANWALYSLYTHSETKDRHHITPIYRRTLSAIDSDLSGRYLDDILTATNAKVPKHSTGSDLMSASAPPKSDDGQAPNTSFRSKEQEQSRKYNTETESTEVLDVAFAPIDELIIILASDLTLRYFYVSNRDAIHQESVASVGSTRLHMPYTKIALWAGCVHTGSALFKGSRLMFLIGPREYATILAFRPFDGRPRPGTCRQAAGKPPRVAEFGILQGHTDVITDLLVLSQPNEIISAAELSDIENYDGAPENVQVLPREAGVLATASLDRTIRLWALPSCECVQTLREHRAGVRTLTYDPSQRLLLSAGFEFDIRAFAITGHRAVPIFELQGGHSASIRFIAAAPGDARGVVSLDDAGTICWWDVSRDSGCNAQERLTQCFTLGVDQSCTVVAPVGYGIDLDFAYRTWIEAASRSQDNDQCTDLAALGPCQALSASAVTWSTNAVSIFCGNNRGELALYDAKESRPPESAPNCVAYSPQTFELLSTHGPSVKVWDARTGMLKKEHTALTPSGADITAITFDSRGLRCIVVDGAGSVTLCAVSDGQRLVSFTSNQAEITSLVRLPEENIFVVAGWDRAIHIYDELKVNPHDSLLRQVHNAHSTDIISIAVSRDAGLIATAASDSTISFWDFEDLKLYGQASYPNGRAVGLATSIKFLDPYPFLIVLDVHGLIAFIKVPFDGGPKERSVVLAFPNCSKNQTTGISSQAFATHVSSTEALLITGGIDGVVRIFNIRPALEKLEVGQISHDSLRWRNNGYDARRRVQRDHALAKFGGRGLKRPSRGSLGDLGILRVVNGIATAADIQLVREWKAHEKSISYVLLTEDPERIITASSDDSIRCWTSMGKSCGVLTFGRDGDANRVRLFATTVRAGLARSEADESWNFVGSAQIYARAARIQEAARQMISIIIANKRRSNVVEKEVNKLKHMRKLTSNRLGSDTRAEGHQSLSAMKSQQEYERNRVFEQLAGKKTWLLSEFEKSRILARKQSNFDPPRRRTRRRKKRRGRSKKTDDISIDNDDTGRVLDGRHIFKLLSDDVEKRAARFRAREQIRQDLRKHEIRQDAHDPENFGVGSINWESSMYQNLYQTKSPSKAASNVKSTSYSARLSAEINKLVEPSDFVTKQLALREKQKSSRISVRTFRTESQLLQSQDCIPPPDCTRTVECIPAPEVDNTECPIDRTEAIQEGEAPNPLTVASSSSSTTQSSEQPSTFECVAQPKSMLPVLPADHTVVVAMVKERVKSWRERVETYAQMCDTESSPRGYVRQNRRPLMNKKGDSLFEVHHRKSQSRMPPLPSAAKLSQHYRLHKLRSNYGPAGCYPTKKIKDLVTAFESLLPKEESKKPLVRLADLSQHQTVLEHGYLSKQAGLLHSQLGQESRLSLRALLNHFFPLLKGGEVNELYVYFAQVIGKNANEQKTRTIEQLHHLFTLFDISGTGEIDLAEFKDAISEGAHALNINENWSAVQQSIERQMDKFEKERKKGEAPVKLGFSRFCRMIQDAVISS